MDRDQIEELIDSKIRIHEIKVGIVSGIIGIFFVFGIMHSIWLMKHWVS